MAMEYSTGLMELIMKETGYLIKLKDKELFGMLKVMFIEVNSKTIWLMDMENILTSMVPNIKENLEMMYKKDMVRKSGLMEPNTLEATKMV